MTFEYFMFCIAWVHVGLFKSLNGKLYLLCLFPENAMAECSYTSGNHWCIVSMSLVLFVYPVSSNFWVLCKCAQFFCSCSCTLVGIIGLLWAHLHCHCFLVCTPSFLLFPCVYTIISWVRHYFFYFNVIIISCVHLHFFCFHVCTPSFPLFPYVYTIISCVSICVHHHFLCFHMCTLSFPLFQCVYTIISFVSMCVHHHFICFHVCTPSFPLFPCECTIISSVFMCVPCTCLYLSCVSHTHSFHFTIKLACKLKSQDTFAQIMTNALHNINPFTAPACKISGLNAAWMRLQTVLFLVLQHQFSILYILVEILSHAIAEKKAKRFMGFKYRTFMGCFQMTSWQWRG